MKSPHDGIGAARAKQSVLKGDKMPKQQSTVLSPVSNDAAEQISF